MIIIVGLGNPGEDFKETRHNVGFSFLDKLKHSNNFRKWQTNKKFESKISQGEIHGKKILLLKPQTFMNNSGRAVVKISNYYKVLPEDIWIVHDDIDLELGKLKIVKGKGSGGHKGVESIIKSLGTNDFIRIRIGIRPQSGKPKDVDKFVLKKFNKEEKRIIKRVIEKAIEAVALLIKEGLEKAMTEFNKRGSVLPPPF